MTNIDAEVMERRRARDQMLFSLSDILDAKAGILLVVITFLAELSGDILAAPPITDLWLQVFQVVSIAALGLAGFTAVSSLWVESHLGEDPEELSRYADELRAGHEDEPNRDEVIEPAFREASLKLVKERIAHNAKITERKSWLIDLSFKFTGAALVLNLLTLLGRLFY